MGDPLLQHAAKRVERGTAAIQADREVVPLVAVPVKRRIGGVERIEVDRAQRRPVLLQELAQASEAAGRGQQLDRFEVGRHHRAVGGDGDLLRAEEHFGGPRLERIRVGAEDVPQQDLGQLMDEKRRHVDAFPEQRDVRGLERRGGGDPVPEAQPDAVVLARVGVDDRRPARCPSTGAARRRDQLLVQRELRRARLAESARAPGRSSEARRKSSVRTSRPSAPTFSSR